jgi:hypothetical protein
VIGGDGTPAVSGFGLEELAAAPAFASRGLGRAGDDLVESYGRLP